MLKPVSIGVVGCGYWGPNLIRNIHRLPGATLAFICDTDPLRLDHVARLYPEAGTCEDIQTVLSATDVDAVVIATPVGTHHTLAKASLEAGKHTFLEKPMALSVAECRELIEIARDKNLILMVGHTYLYSTAVRKILEIIESGDIGDIRYINCQRLNLGIFQKDVNVAWDLAPHDISIILQIVGCMPATVNCQGQANVQKGVEDVTNLSLTFPSGAFATIQSSWLEPRKVRTITVVGTRKMVIFDDLQPSEKLRVYDLSGEAQKHYDNFAEFQSLYHHGDCYIPKLDQGEPLQQMCAHFVDCIRTNQTPLSPGEQGLALVHILEASTESLKRNGAPVMLAPLNTEVHC